ncbi:MAG: carbohydrate ABC transporter permease [Anaerolineae bacterium]|nr:carbohydrate ABC transporter permease [Anaerolineae bacterium]
MVWHVIVYVVLVVSALFMVVPFLWTVSTSLKADQYVLTMPPQFLPQPLTFQSYVRLAELLPVGQMFFNSLLVAGLTTLGQLATCSMAAYAFARMRFKGQGALFLVYLATLMIPFQVTITPLFILMRYLGWINTYQGIIFPGVFSAFGTFLLRQSFLTMPRELDEAAFLDGASHLTVYWRIILPLGKPALATLGVFSFMGSWNAFLWPLFVARDVEMMTLPVGLAMLHGRWLTEWNLVMAGTVITILPMLIVYLLAQKYFVEGVLMSGIKR